MINNLKQKLLDLEIALDNEYLDKYVELITINIHTKKEKFKTHMHHIIPRYFSKDLYNIQLNNELDNYIKNTDYSKCVNLTIKDHILAHCYLEKCSTVKYKSKNLFAVFKLSGRNKQLMINMLYNYVDDVEILNNLVIMINEDVVFTDGHKKHLSESTKHRKSSTNDNISRSGYVGGVTGLKMIYDLNGKRRYINKDEVEYYLSIGWTLPTNKKKSNVINDTTQKHTYSRHMSQEDVHKHLSDSHLGHTPSNKGVPRSDETKEKLRLAILGRRWVNNGIEQRQVKIDELDEFLNNGYVIGCLKKGR